MTYLEQALKSFLRNETLFEVLAPDLHVIIDLFVINGIMSPYPQKSLITDQSWNEISPAMFWG